MITMILSIWACCGLFAVAFMSRVFTHNRAREEAQRRMR